MGQTFSLDSTNDQVTIKTTQPGTSSTLGSAQLQVLQGPEGPRGKDAVVDYAELASSVVTNPQLYGVVRDGLVRDPQFQGVVTQYFKDNSILFRGEKGVTDFKSLSFDEKASIVNMIIQQNKDDFVKGFVESQDLKKAIVDLLAKIPEIRGQQGIQGPKGDKGDQGTAGKDAVVDYPRLTQSVVGNSQMLDAVRSGLITDNAFKAVITKYFSDNAQLFRGERGVTEFKALSVDEKAAIVTMIVQQNKAEFAKGLAENNDFRQAIINALVIRPELKGPQGERGVPGPVGPAGKDGLNGKDAVVDYTQLGSVVSTTQAFANSISSGLAGRSDFAKIVSDNQDLRKNVVDQMSVRNEFKGPQGAQGPVGPAGKDADGFVGMWIAQRFQRGGASDFITNPYSTYGVKPAIETALIGTMNLDDKCRFTGNAIWQSANIGYNAVYSTRILVTSNFPVNMDNVRGTNPFSIFINGRRANGQFLFESGSWYTIELFHGVESSGQDAFVELGWNPKNLKQNIGTVVAIMKNGLMGTSAPAPSTVDASKLVGSVVAGQQVSFDGSLIQDGTIPFIKFGIAQGESLPVRMMPMIPDSKITGMSAAKITGPGTLDYSLLPNIRSDKLVDNDIEGKKIKDGTLNTSKLTGVFGDSMFLDNTLSGGKIKDGSLNTSKLTGNIDASRINNLPGGFPGWKVSNKDVLEFGVGIQKEVNAGKIGYTAFANSDALDIVGAGTGQIRKVKIWDNLEVGGNITALSVNANIDASKITGTIDGSKITGNIDGSKVTGNIDGSKVTGNIDGSKVTGNIDGSKVTGNIDGSKITGNINASKITGLPSSGFSAEYEQFSKATDGRTAGTWSKDPNTNSWDPAFRGSRTGSIYNSEQNNDNASGTYVDYDVPSNMKQAYVVFLPWGNTRYFNIFGINNTNDEVFVRSVDATAAKEGHANGNFNAVTAASVAGVNRFKTLRIRGGRGRMHLMGVGWTREEGRGMETGFIHADNIAGELSVDRIPVLPTSKISGNLDSSRITGNFDSSRITGNLDSSRITGNFDGSRITGNIDASKIKNLPSSTVQGVGWDTQNNGVTIGAGNFNKNNVAVRISDNTWFPYIDGNTYIRPGKDNGIVNVGDDITSVVNIGNGKSTTTIRGKMNSVPIGDTFLRQDGDWVRLVNPGDAFNNDNNRYNKGLAAKEFWAKDKIFASGKDILAELAKVEGIDRLVLDGWYKDRFNFTNGLHVDGGAWDRKRGGKEPSIFKGELIVQNGDNNYTHFNHKNENRNYIRGDTSFDGKIIGGIKICNPNNLNDCKSYGW